MSNCSVAEFLFLPGNQPSLPLWSPGHLQKDYTDMSVLSGILKGQKQGINLNYLCDR